MMGDPGHAEPRLRYTQRALPAYRHVPGFTPHPIRDPDGHSYGLPALDLPDLNTEAWETCEEYLYGIDLFNEGYWWESHEVLEGLWHAAGIGSPAAHALQAVIQCAAAHLKASIDCPRGAMRLHDHSLRHAKWSGHFKLGVDHDKLVVDTRTFLTVDGAAPARIVLQIPLETPAMDGE
jgi:hypothetical protein